MWTEIEIGSNIFRNTPAVLIVEGQRQAHLERGDIDQQVLLTMDLYDRGGERAARLRRNAWVFHQERYEVTTNPESLRLMDVSAAVPYTVLEVNVEGRDRLVIPRGVFYARSGQRVVITSDELRIGAFSLKGTLMNNCEGGIGIG